MVPDTDDLEALRRAAHEVMREWPAQRAETALRAMGLSRHAPERESLDAIAADVGISRETARRARNALQHGLTASTDQRVGYLARLLAPPKIIELDQSAAPSRALRRVLTMTGCLAWDEVLSAWERGGGKPPYTPLPADAASVSEWVRQTGGFIVRRAPDIGGLIIIDTAQPEELDQVSQFLYEMLRGHPGGIDRAVLLESAEAAGLKPTTIATTLSHHPAVMRVGRGSWALRGRHEGWASELSLDPPPRRPERVRPTGFSWGPDGDLILEFSVPRGASPVIAVPKAVADLIEGREFTLQHDGRLAHIKVRKARLWGFGPLVSQLALSRGQRARLELNLISSTALFAVANGKD